MSRETVNDVARVQAKENGYPLAETLVAVLARGLVDKANTVLCEALEGVAAFLKPLTATSAVAATPAITATNSAGVTGRIVTLGTVHVFSGAGSPESVVTAPIGSAFIRTDGGAGTTWYLKESGTGNTGWAGI